MKLLLAAGASKSALDKDGWTALHHAASVGNAEAIQLQLASGANAHSVSSPMDQRRTAVHIAAVHGHCDALTALLSAGATLNDVDAKGDTLLHHAADMVTFE